ncbi:MAG: FKBP-type peptidyl-prolyl cis-trans isomerase [Prevotellaceae bacterium]|jgi:FKBP-type peptidyl-prolyl cis-trans isomerase|nr:FKBP-type peptidyl-prolyl cis-trans isomerase [Prevotellaceae bacterium]
MKHVIYLFSVVFLMASCDGGKNVKLSSSASPEDSVSYAIGVFEGYSTAGRLKNVKFDVDYDYLIAGYKSVIAKDSVNEQDMQRALDEVNQYFQKKTKAENAAFLEENKKKDSIVVLPSGLQYKVIAEGAGISPEVSDTVNVIYTGTFTDGRMFDSSRGNVAKMPLPQMIQGWKEGIPLMKEGAKYKFYIPAALAYGESGHQLAGMTLIFDVELVSIIKGNN